MVLVWPTCPAALAQCAVRLVSRVSQRDTCHTRAREHGSSKPAFVDAAGPVARGDSPLGQATQAAVSQAYQIGAGPGR